MFPSVSYTVLVFSLGLYVSCFHLCLRPQFVHFFNSYFSVHFHQHFSVVTKIFSFILSLSYFILFR